MATMKTVHGNTYDEAGLLAAQAILGTGIRVSSFQEHFQLLVLIFTNLKNAA